ncbi:MAG: CHAP domain-containing protein [Haliangium ochraceum]
MTDIGRRASSARRVREPGNRRNWPGYPVACFVVGIGVAMSAFGCGHARVEARRLPAWVFESSRTEHPLPPPRQARPHGGIRGRNLASDFVVAALQDAGLRFGTDGTVASLWGYLRGSHPAVSPAEARTGDVLFFQTRRPLAGGCDGRDNQPDHVAIVAAVDPGGRITFVEARDGRVHRSFAAPDLPRVRRDGAGRILNTFLRPKTAGDPPDTPSYAGEMLCATIRPEI